MHARQSARADDEPPEPRTPRPPAGKPPAAPPTRGLRVHIQPSSGFASWRAAPQWVGFMNSGRAPVMGSRPSPTTTPWLSARAKPPCTWEAGGDKVREAVLVVVASGVVQAGWRCKRGDCRQGDGPAARSRPCAHLLGAAPRSAQRVRGGVQERLRRDARRRYGLDHEPGGVHDGGLGALDVQRQAQAVARLEWG